MAVLTISEGTEGIGEKVAINISQRLDFVLVDTSFIGNKLHMPDSLNLKKLTNLIDKKQISPKLIKKLIIEQALKNNIIVLNLGGEILFHNLPGTMHIKLHSSPEKKEDSKLVKEQKSGHKAIIRELYGNQNPGEKFYDIQIRTDNSDTDFAADLIVQAVETKRITTKAGVTLKALKRLKSSMDNQDSTSESEENLKYLLPPFAHPSEKDFAKILDFYRIKWEYEPRSFILEVDEEGNPKAEFTPDFYLPDLDLYIELTTRKQSLVTKKNRKLRKLKKLYPDVNIKIFYRDDYEKIAERFGIEKKSGPK